MSTAKRKEAAQKADEMIQSMAEQANQPAPEGAEQESAAADGQESFEQLPDQGDTPPGDDQGREAGQEGQEDSGQEPPASAPREETAEYWKHKFKSLDGILRSKDDQIEQMREVLASMQEHFRSAPRNEGQDDSAPPQEQAHSTEALVTREDETAFGADLIDLIRRVSKEELSGLRASLSQEFQGLKSQVSEVSTSVKQTAKERFNAKLDQHDPKWRDLDRDPAFIAWLRESPTRAKEWSAAVANLDHVAVAEKFDTYKLLAEAENRRNQEPADKRKQELERQVAPGKSKTPARRAQAGDEKRTWTSSEIAQAFTDRKKYSPQEWATMEKEIFQAQSEGRVDYSR